jgi:ABC-type phosphate transport system substrate-binding protein
MPESRGASAVSSHRLSGSSAQWTWVRTLTVVMIGVLYLAAAPQRYKVIVHSQVAVSSLTSAELSQLFMKRVTKWRQGTPVVPVDQRLGSEVREAFSHDVHGKGAAAVDAYWQKQIFSGRDVPPVTKASDGDVVAYVRANAGAIGYVSTAAETGGVKAIEVR